MFTIIKKELKDCFRDRRTLLLSVLLPIILMSGLVFYYEGSIMQGEGETYTIAIPEGALEVVEAIFTEGTLTFEEVTDVKQVVTAAEVEAGLILPINFIEMVQNEQNPPVQILADAFSANGSFAASQLEIGLATFSQQQVMNTLMSENIDPAILQPFTIENIQTVEGDNSIIMITYLISLMLSLTVFAGAYPAASDLLAGEKERKTMEALLMTPVNRFTLLFAKWFTLVVIASITGIITLIVLSIEIYFFTDALKAGLQFENGMTMVILACCIITISYSTLVAALLLLASLLAKTIKESQSYISPLMAVAMVPAIFMVTLGVNELTTTHFIVPILNIFAIFKELLLGIIDYSHIAIVLGSNLVVVVLLLMVARLFFLKDRWVVSN